MTMLGSYEMDGRLSNENAGYSMWGFGKKNGKDYFIKQFLAPRYPHNDPHSTPKQIERRKTQCESFERQKVDMYKVINEHSDGNAVRIEEFFRIDARYYMTMQKINALPWTVEFIASMDESTKRYLCAIIAHGVAGLHKGRVVHADLKHDNIIFTQTRSGHFTAKIIDFDSGFLETNPPGEDETIVGDQVYFSPEACMACMGESATLTCKMDIFALGVLFHQYFTGQLPGFDHALGDYVGVAVARGGTATANPELPEDLRPLIERMLSLDPDQRPTAMEVYAALLKKTLKPDPESEHKPEPAPEHKPEPGPEHKPEPAPEHTVDPSKHFKFGGDLL